jgi:multisubunit Na+/H+ antiporter MnhB subunit
MDNLLVRFVAAAVLAVTWIIIWVQLIYAADLPGEGFSASVLLLLVVMLQYVVLGRARAAVLLPPWVFRAALMAGVGLLVLLVAGPLVAGAPLLRVFKVPVGPLALSSTFLFDLALFLVVGGSMLTAMAGLREARS